MCRKALSIFVEFLRRHATVLLGRSEEYLSKNRYLGRDPDIVDDKPILITTLSKVFNGYLGRPMCPAALRATWSSRSSGCSVCAAQQRKDLRFELHASLFCDFIIFHHTLDNHFLSSSKNLQNYGISYHFNSCNFLICGQAPISK